ncbi:glycerophosphodiester phosphodiesterase [Pseudomonas donghuensis]|uniref:glycerophosphodiester phosphodiesterase n=1 Tax=Pseudomonas donghuensis TaxID=1163398 RepID=UPI000C2963B8|nr:glycerophosphodiester phosphodiesterase [Pseudomonas donghuensis]PJY95120.1 glycerophosphodiester phosphodiesterase [Pseudomonas donghuensis]WKY27365.1 glycerophosphodiester phosphodiesterase [Pseudomonas donghuensis]
MLNAIGRVCCLALLPLAGLAEAGQGAELARAQDIPYPAVIAHRGASYDAPESTAPAYRLARELGADYLELDLQRSSDGVLVAVHDDNLLRTSDVAERFPERKNSPVSAFTLAELKSLDVGSWFNKAYPERARASFKGLKIQTLDEVMAIAAANPKHQPGLYIETKVPGLFPGIEADLKNSLQAKGWLARPGKVVLQSFDRSSLALLHQHMPQVPKVLLLWIGKGSMEPASQQTFAESGERDKAAFYARQQPKDKAEFERWLDYAKADGAIGTGPSAALTEGGAQSYADLVQPWMNQLTHDKGLLVHVYTVDEPVDFRKVLDAGVDGIFSNRSGQLLRYLARPSARSEAQILRAEGY